MSIRDPPPRAASQTTPRGAPRAGCLTPGGACDTVSAVKNTVPKAPSYPIESVDNALKLLHMLRKRSHIRVSEASSSIGVARSTAHRLLAMLQHHGFVRQDPFSRAYVAGPALLDFGRAILRDRDIRTHARPFLERLSRETGETVHLIALQGREVLGLRREHEGRAGRESYRPPLAGALRLGRQGAARRAPAGPLPSPLPRGAARGPDPPIDQNTSATRTRAEPRPEARVRYQLRRNRGGHRQCWRADPGPAADPPSGPQRRRANIPVDRQSDLDDGEGRASDGCCDQRSPAMTATPAGYTRKALDTSGGKSSSEATCRWQTPCSQAYWQKASSVVRLGSSPYGQ